MPWLFNPTRDVHPVLLQDGTKYGFLPRKRVYIQPDKMSAEVWRLVGSGKLANQGGDPVVQPVRAPVADPPPPVVVEQSASAQPANTDTSSAHHSADARVAVDSSIADHGEKDTKAVKKQNDDLKKATSEKSEADLKNSDTKTEKRSKGSRRRT